MSAFMAKPGCRTQTQAVKHGVAEGLNLLHAASESTGDVTDRLVYIIEFKE